MVNIINPHVSNPRITNRTPKQQAYRDELATTLLDLRSNDKGKAYDTLLKEKGTPEYLLAKYGWEKKSSNKLIEIGQGRIVAKYLKNFEGLNHQEIADKLFQTEQGRIVAKYLNNFEGLNHQEIADKLFQTEQGQTVARYLNNFEGLNHQEIADKLFQTEQGQTVARYLNNFKGLNETTITRAKALKYSSAK